MDQYKYLTGKDLGYKSEVVGQATFECSSLGKVFNKRLEKKGKIQGLLKRLKKVRIKSSQKQLKIKENNNWMQLKKIIN